MKYCEKCNVSIRGSLKRCPLCQNSLRGSDEPAVYPVIPDSQKQFALFFKISTLSAIFAVVVCMAIDIAINSHAHWSVFAAFGIACSWLSLSIAIKKRRTVPANITCQAVLIGCLSFLWDYYTGFRGWSIDFVIPITCTAAALASVILEIIMGLNKDRFILCVGFNILFSFIPLCFYLSDKLHVFVPSIVSIASGILSLSILVLFKGKFITQELKRHFHI